MANEEQARFWTEQAGPIWLANESLLDVSARTFGLEALDAAEVATGERVVDVGCGTGSTTVEIAKRVGPAGRVLGVDISPLLLSRARERAVEEDAANVEFVAADAQTHRFADGTSDLVYSRFGVMFFDDPVAAFVNLRTALAPDGRLAFVCWQDAKANAWMSVPAMAAASVLGPPDPPPPDAPGPFRFADVERVRLILDGAGFTGIEFRDFTTTMDTPTDQASERLTFTMRMGPLGMRYAQVDEATQQRAFDAVMDAVAPFASNGAYRLPAAAWIVTARAT